MGIFPHGSNQSGTQRVGDEIAGDWLQVSPVTDRMIVETSLPDSFAGCVSFPVDRRAAAGFVAPEQIGQRAFGQLQQPVQMVRHQDEGQGGAYPGSVASMQFPYRQAGKSEIGEQRQTVLRHGGDDIAAPDFRDASGGRGEDSS